MTKSDLSCMCKKTLATVHCKNGDYRITGLCAAIIVGIILMHIIMCICIKCSFKSLAKKACECSC